MNEKVLELGLPTGSLQDRTLEFLRQAGYSVSFPAPRSYHPSLGDLEIACTLLRAQEIPYYVQNGKIDTGLTGWDWVEEQKHDRSFLDQLLASCQGIRPIQVGQQAEPAWTAVAVAEFCYSKVGRASRWVLAVHRDSSFFSACDLTGEKPAQRKWIETELPNLTKRYLRENGVHAWTSFSWGASEGKPPHIADAVVVVSDSGATLRDNDLREIAEIFVSKPVLIANARSWKDPWKRDKIMEIASRLLSVVEGRLLDTITPLP